MRALNLPRHDRWFVLSVLFSARVAMAFQFQSVAALSPLIMAEFAVGLAEITIGVGVQ